MDNAYRMHVQDKILKWRKQGKDKQEVLHSMFNDLATVSVKPSSIYRNQTQRKKENINNGFNSDVSVLSSNMFRHFGENNKYLYQQVLMTGIFDEEDGGETGDHQNESKHIHVSQQRKDG